MLHGGSASCSSVIGHKGSANAASGNDPTHCGQKIKGSDKPSKNLDVDCCVDGETMDHKSSTGNLQDNRVKSELGMYVVLVLCFAERFLATVSAFKYSQ